MSDTYADEFEKWLENGPSAKSTDMTEEEESNDESDHYRNGKCDVNSSHNSDSQLESEKLKKHLLCGHGKKISSGSVSEQAPILVDDEDEDMFSSKKEEYEDEPPILEPISSQLHSYKVSTIKSPEFCPQICMRNYSRNNQISSRIHILKESRTCDVEDNFSHMSPDTCDISSHRGSLKSINTKNDNLFDNFISENCEDCPPPLIPSPQALQIYSESPSSRIKCSSHIPDFCAMEADSTSEINGGRIVSVFRSQRLSRNSGREVLVECDSTCMLAASPIIVSPASVSNGEMDEAIDSGEGTNENGELDSIDNKSKTCNTPKGSSENEQHSISMQTEVQNYLVNEIACTDASEDKYFHKVSVLQAVGGLSSHPQPLIHDINIHLGSDSKSLSVDIETNTQNGVSEFTIDPPILSAVSPQSVRYHTRFRNKRHTVDSPDTFSRSRKRLHIISCPQTDIESCVCDVTTPPTLMHVSEAVMTNTSRGKCSGTVSQHSKADCPSCHQNVCLSRKRRRRCKSLPVADETEPYRNLSAALRSFVVGTSELSYLQTHMHRLLYQLFPQLKTELDTMSPESYKFESLVSDLVKLLEQPDDQKSSAPPPLILFQDIKPTFIYECPRLVSVTPELNCASQSDIRNLSSPLLSTYDSQAAVDFVKHVKSNEISSNHQSSTPVLSSSNLHNYQQKQHRYGKTQTTSQDDDRDLVIPLSQLIVKDIEEFLIPSKVLLCKDPGTLLQRFVQLSCRALQLLLPDLPVSVYSELAQYPSHLVAFINKVIHANTKR